MSSACNEGELQLESTSWCAGDVIDLLHMMASLQTERLQQAKCSTYSFSCIYCIQGQLTPNFNLFPMMMMMMLEKPKLRRLDLMVHICKKEWTPTDQNSLILAFSTSVANFVLILIIFLNKNMFPVLNYNDLLFIIMIQQTS